MLDKPKQICLWAVKFLPLTQGEDGHEQKCYKLRLSVVWQRRWSNANLSTPPDNSSEKRTKSSFAGGNEREIKRSYWCRSAGIVFTSRCSKTRRNPCPGTVAKYNALSVARSIEEQRARTISTTSLIMIHTTKKSYGTSELIRLITSSSLIDNLIRCYRSLLARSVSETSEWTCWPWVGVGGDRHQWPVYTHTGQ